MPNECQIRRTRRNNSEQDRFKTATKRVNPWFTATKLNTTKQPNTTFNNWVEGSSPSRITNLLGGLRRLVGRLFLLVCELEFLVAMGDTSQSTIVLASRERLASNNPLHPD